MGNGTVQDAVTDRSGITGEKMELDGYMTVEGASTVVYNHMNRNGLCTIVAFNKAVEEGLAKQIAMQIAAMNPIAVDEDGVSEEIKQKEIDVAIEKTKAEQVQKAVEAALKKAGINPAHMWTAKTTWKATWPKAGLLLKTWQRQRKSLLLFLPRKLHICLNK